jgi:translin
MEEIYHLLMLFDYPDAITRGLRRKSDLARSMLERTRGDLTNAIEMSKVEATLRVLNEKLKETGS